LIVPVVEKHALAQLLVESLVLLLDVSHLFLRVGVLGIIKLFEESFFVGILEELGVLCVDLNSIVFGKVALWVVVDDRRVNPRVLAVTQHQLTLARKWLLDVVAPVVVQVGVLQQFVPGKPLFGIVLEAAVQKVEAFEAELDMLGEHVIANLKVVHQVVFAHARERGKSGQHFEEHRAQAPNVNFVVIRLPQKDFRRHVKRCSTLRFGKFSRIEGFCKTKVGDDHVNFSYQRSGSNILLKVGT